MPTSPSRAEIVQMLSEEAGKIDLQTCNSADMYLKTLLNMAAASMQPTLFKWKVVIEIEDEVQEDVDDTILQHRIINARSGRIDFKLQLYYGEELVFSLTTKPGQDPQMFMRMMENRMPWDCLLDAANHIG